MESSCLPSKTDHAGLWLPHGHAAMEGEVQGRGKTTVTLVKQLRQYKHPGMHKGCFLPECLFSTAGRSEHAVKGTQGN